MISCLASPHSASNPRTSSARHHRRCPTSASRSTSSWEASTISYCQAYGTCSVLTHLSWDKMAANLADNIFKYIFINEKFHILIRILLEFVPRGPIDNRPALVQVMAWRRTDDKPLPETTLTHFTDAYMRH